MNYGPRKDEARGGSFLTVEEFARAVGISERSAWNVFKTGVEMAKSTGRPNRLPPVDADSGFDATLGARRRRERVD